MSVSGMPICRIAGSARRPAAAAIVPAGTCWTPGNNLAAPPRKVLPERRGHPPQDYQGAGAQPSSGLNHPVTGEMPILPPGALVEMTVPLPRLIVT